MAVILNRQTVAQLNEAGRIFFDHELKGFGLRVHQAADGTIRKSFIVQYRVGKQQRRQKIGDATKLNADQARKRATEMLAKVTLGHDPAAEKEATRASTALTFKRAVEQYLELRKTDLRPSSLRIATLYLTGTYFSQMHAMPVSKVTRSHVSLAVDKIVASGASVTARQARAHLSAFFVWCLQRGHCDLNPTIGSASPEVGPSRDRVLSGDELGAIWRACRDDEFGKIVKLLMLTGCRRSEIGGLRWSEIDLDQGTLTIPASRSKNHRALTLPLTPMMVEIIESVPRCIDRDPLFGERAEGFTSFQHSRLDDGCKAWRLHDLRRSVATHMAEIGVQPHIIETILNHASGHKGGVAGIYNRAQYAKEVKTALLRWSEHIDEIVNGRARTVVAFPRSA